MHMFLNFCTQARSRTFEHLLPRHTKKKKTETEAV